LQSALNNLSADSAKLGKKWIAALSTGIVATYVVLWVAFLGRVGPRDFDQFLVFHELQYWNAALFGLAKQWSPVMCGGLSLAGEPQVPFLSLSMLLSYGLGPLAGLEVAVALYFAFGWAGAWLYAGLWWPRSGPRVLAASLFIGNGFFACRLAYGHIDFVPFLSLPMMLWALHRSIGWVRDLTGVRRIERLTLALLLFAAGISVVVDGSPVAIIHLLFWVGLYALILAFVTRSASPIVLYLAALGLALVLDAGYLWPMLSAQAQFPRLTANTFTNPISLPWFLLLPVTGKLIIPATGKGHELSVYIGPVLAYLIWRYRRPLLADIPSTMRTPLLVVGLLSIWLGMGSLEPLHVPTVLSPFDWLRPLPGFRSLMVTGRYWGFLALPLSLFAAGALRSFATQPTKPRYFQVWMSAVIALQLGFQVFVILHHWLPGRVYEPVEFRPAFRDGADSINYVPLHQGFQGRLIRPTQGVINCYDGDDFIHASVSPGSTLVKSVSGDDEQGRLREQISARFLSWSRIQLRLHNRFLAVPTSYVPLEAGTAPDHLLITLNQAYHPQWRAPECTIRRSEQGNMVVDCPYAALKSTPVSLEFRDAMSARGVEVSRVAWIWWLLIIGLVSFLAALRSTLPRTAREPEEPLPLD